MGSPNKDVHFEWIRSATRAGVDYDYVKLSIEEMDIAERYIMDLLDNYDEGNERADMAEMLCMFASIYASRSPHEQQGILVSALNRSKEVHDELHEEEKKKLSSINKLINSPKKNK